MLRTVVPFYLGLGSRYSYLAVTQLDRIEKAYNVQFKWCPLQSGELIKRAHNGRSPFDGNQQFGQYDWAYRRHDAEAWADLYGVRYAEPKPLRVDPSDLAKACWVADMDGRRKSMAWRILRAIFVEGRVMSRDELSVLASEIGLNGSELVAALDTPAISARHEAALDRALDEGAFGVPSFNLAGQIFWGNDRLVLLERALSKQAEEKAAEPGP